MHAQTPLHPPGRKQEREKEEEDEEKEKATRHTWTPSDTHLDTNTVHGQTLFRTIQPTQWSRKYNLAGQPVLDIFPWQLSRFGLQDHSLRTLF